MENFKTGSTFWNSVKMTGFSLGASSLGGGGGRGKEERACNDVSGIWMPPQILPAANYCSSCQDLANRRKPETIANINKHVKGTILLSGTLRKTGILADKNYSFSDRVCLPCATKVRKFSQGFNFIVSTLKAIDQKVEVTNIVPRVKQTMPTSLSTPQNYWTEQMSKTAPVRPGEKEAVQGNR